MEYNNIEKASLSLAEQVDAWRVIPRVLVLAYCMLVVYMYLWFKSIPTHPKIQCDSMLIKILLDNDIDINQANTLACHVVDVVGGPTMGQTTLVTAIISLSAAIFGLYTATGRKWEMRGRMFGPSPYGPNPYEPNPYNPSPYGPTQYEPSPYGPRPYLSSKPTENANKNGETPIPQQDINDGTPRPQ